MAAIKITNLTKQFGSFKAVNDISLEVGEKQVFGFLGPNGAGKTTTIRMLAGLSKPTKGSIEIAGKEVIFGNPAASKAVGYLPEQPSFYNWMTGIEYLEFIAEIFQIDSDKRQSKIKELLSLVDLSNAKNKRIGTYSNGMKQRLGIAQALINEPAVLILDEPVSALDPIGRREVLSIIEQLKDKSTIIMSTHILSDVDKICDQIAIIKNGSIVTTSSLANLKEKYATAILEVEFSKDPGNAMTKDLEKESWLKKVEKSGNKIRVWLKDDKAIDQNIPLEYFVKQKIGILRYGLALPEVEDLFIEILKEKK